MDPDKLRYEEYLVTNNRDDAITWFKEAVEKLQKQGYSVSYLMADYGIGAVTVVAEGFKSK